MFFSAQRQLFTRFVVCFIYIVGLLHNNVVLVFYNKLGQWANIDSGIYLYHITLGLPGLNHMTRKEAHKTPNQKQRQKQVLKRRFSSLCNQCTLSSDIKVTPLSQPPHKIYTSLIPIVQFQAQSLTVYHLEGLFTNLQPNHIPISFSNVSLLALM